MMRNLHRETGSAMVTAMLVTMLLLSIGFTTMSLVDNSTKDSGRERKRESAFALSEGVLNSQIFLLSREWPATSSTAYPSTCSKSSESDRRCPSEAALVKTFNSADYQRGITWTTEIRDNTAGVAADYYNDSTVRAQPTWDANGDTFMWVRARGVLPDGRSRTLVALVQAELLTLNFPRAAVVAGSLSITQSGNQTYVDTDGDGTEAGAVILRCDVSSSSCADWDPNKKHIAPQTPTSNVNQASALTSDVIERLRETARAQNRYYAQTSPKNATNSACPPADATGLHNPGGVIFIENASVCSTYNPSGNQTASYNSAANPGVLVIGSGQFAMQGNQTYYGLVYHVNASDGYPGNVALSGSSTPAVTLKSGAVVRGAVIIDGAGHINLGNNSGGSAQNGNVIYDPNVFNSMKAYGTAGIVQNSFRELPGSNTN